MNSNDNRRETGVRVPLERGDKDEGDRGKAAGNRPPKGIGLSESVDETENKARHSDGTNQPADKRRGGR